jgi:hypothetical protein
MPDANPFCRHPVPAASRRRRIPERPVEPDPCSATSALGMEVRTEPEPEQTNIEIRMGTRIVRIREREPEPIVGSVAKRPPSPILPVPPMPFVPLPRTELRMRKTSRRCRSGLRLRMPPLGTHRLCRLIRSSVRWPCLGIPAGTRPAAIGLLRLRLRLPITRLRMVLCQNRSRQNGAKKRQRNAHLFLLIRARVSIPSPQTVATAPRGYRFTSCRGRNVLRIARCSSVSRVVMMFSMARMPRSGVCGSST